MIVTEGESKCLLLTKLNQGYGMLLLDYVTFKKYYKLGLKLLKY